MSGALEKRKFYIIAHNPNTIEDAKAFLLAGANALEPDICVSDDKDFFVSHDHTAFSNPFSHEHNLVTYLTELRAFIEKEGDKINLSLIMWDYKDPDAKLGIDTFLKVVHDNFSKFPSCADIAMGVTNASLSHAGFLTKYDGKTTNVAVGVDEEKDPNDVVKRMETDGQKHYSYANGIIKTGIKLGVFHSMLNAKALQHKHEGLKLIYTWVMENQDAMRDFLHIHIDGIIVDLDHVGPLKSILLENDFSPNYELARKGYNPWVAEALPSYYCIIHTADVTWAGTDAVIKFELFGEAGSLTTVLNSDYKDILEQGTIDVITLEGKNIGKVTKLKITALTSDSSSDWLPLRIRVRSNIDKDEAVFDFGPDDWVKKDIPMTKTANAP